MEKKQKTAKWIFKRPVTIIALVIVCVLAVWWTWWWFSVPHLPSTYSAEPTAGKIIDAETKEPLEGAVVVAAWNLIAPYGLMSSISAGTMHIDEAITDSNGNYFIPGWGPKKRRGRAYLSFFSPEIIVFKEGYTYTVRSNSDWFNDNRYKQLQHSDWSGESISLKRFNGDLATYSKKLSNMPADYIYSYGNCKWLKTPNFIKELGKVRKNADAHGIEAYQPTLEGLIRRDKENCHITVEFIREHMK